MARTLMLGAVAAGMSDSAATICPTLGGSPA
jgi:hypothetical protein